MAVKLPLVLGSNGLPQQLQSGDSISGTGTTVTGTGFLHVIAGVQDAAASLVHDFDMMLAARPNQNFLINGGFDWIQRQAVPGTYTTYASDKYCADRWKLCSQTASTQVKQFDGTGVAGLQSRNYLGIKQITGAGKFMLVQHLENLITVPFSGNTVRTVTFQVTLWASTAKVIKIASIMYSGTADSIAATFVPTWGANTVNPTPATSHTINSSATCSVTTTPTQFSFTVGVTAGSKNVSFAIFTDSQFSAADELYIAEAFVSDGGAVRDWLPRQPADELMLCQRYCYAIKSDATALFAVAASGRGASTSTARFELTLPVEMRVAPSLTVTAADWIILNDVTNPACTAITLTTSATTTKKVRLDVTVSGTPLTISMAYQLLVNNASGKLMIFESEL